MLDKARQSMEAGPTGLIFGRNLWQRPHAESSGSRPRSGRSSRSTRRRTLRRRCSPPLARPAQPGGIGAVSA
nr:hypothetical protein [Actinomycetota bacterium]